MTLRLVQAVAETEQLDDFHLSRLIVLLGSADNRKQTASTKAKAVEGITKLAKLDFLLRYPTYLERALTAVQQSPDLARVEPRERTSIETKMVRFRYGPWDSRYRRWLGLLSARGLVRLGLEGNTVIIGLTDTGRELARALRHHREFALLAERSDVVVRAVGGMPGTKLKNFVYRVFPEITDMKWGEEIKPL
jgi:hypothetical protein